MRKWITNVLAVVVFSGAAVWAVELTEADNHAIAEANKYCERANEFVKGSSLPRAKAEYAKALKIFPRHLDALYNLAVVCEKLGQNDEAIGHYKHYLELSPNDPDVWTQLGVRYDEAGKKADAQAAYEKALASNPKFGVAHHDLGVLLKEAGQFDAAQQHLETFVKLEEEAGRQNGDAYYSLGTLYLARGRIKDAKLTLQKSLDADPSVPYANNAMGDVYLAEKQAELAISAYRRALLKDPKYAPAYSGLGDAYRQQGDRDKAAEAYRKALELRRDYPVVHYKLGLLFEDTKPGEAIKNFENYLASGKNLEFQNEAKARIEKLKQAK
jgi:tetratricopeptide (TPR) repeat protein